ncbi:hypothetical protein X975_14040, partial [Stegodyphus mimosarum]
MESACRTPEDRHTNESWELPGNLAFILVIIKSESQINCTFSECNDFLFIKMNEPLAFFRVFRCNYSYVGAIYSTDDTRKSKLLIKS